MRAEMVFQNFGTHLLFERNFLMKKVGFAVRLLAIAALLSLAAFAVAGCGKDKDTSGNADGSTTGAVSTPDLSNAEPVNSNKTVQSTVGDLDADQKAALAAITGFADATSNQDYKKLCSTYLSKASQKIRAAGDNGSTSCADYFEKTGASIKSFKIYVTGIDVAKDGQTASVDSVTEVNGQKQAPSVIALKKEDGQWRIGVLGQ